MGALLLSWPGELGDLSWGVALIALACLSWGIGNNLTRKISAADPYILAAVKGVAASSVNTGPGFAAGALTRSFARIAGGMALGFVSYGPGHVLFIIALRDISARRAPGPILAQHPSSMRWSPLSCWERRSRCCLCWRMCSWLWGRGCI